MRPTEAKVTADIILPEEPHDASDLAWTYTVQLDCMVEYPDLDRLQARTLLSLLEYVPDPEHLLSRARAKWIDETIRKEKK